eukprot:gene4425-5604_t
MRRRDGGEGEDVREDRVSNPSDEGSSKGEGKHPNVLKKEVGVGRERDESSDRAPPPTSNHVGADSAGIKENANVTERDAAGATARSVKRADEEEVPVVSTGSRVNEILEEDAEEGREDEGAGEDGEDDEVYPYPIGAVVADVGVAFQSKETYVITPLDGVEVTKSMERVAVWTFRGCISGQTELNWRIVSLGDHQDLP